MWEYHIDAVNTGTIYWWSPASVHESRGVKRFENSIEEKDPLSFLIILKSEFSCGFICWLDTLIVLQINEKGCGPLIAGEDHTVNKSKKHDVVQMSQSQYFLHFLLGPKNNLRFSISHCWYSPRSNRPHWYASICIELNKTKNSAEEFVNSDRYYHFIIFG
jgi:hypothetical protein